jgi:putative tryptophan/tyrosine transport system substrate-binding protein
VKRRDFIAVVGGAAVWSLSSRAQQAERVRRVGVLMAVDNSDQRADYAAFLHALQQLGWVDGHNVRIDTRWAGGQASEIRKYAAEMVGLTPDVIVSTGTAAMVPLLQATRIVPIVFANVADPVGAGYVDTMARPGGNATGFVQFEYSLSGKWLELLKQIAPSVTRVAVLRDPNITSGIGQFAVIEATAPSLGVEVSAIDVRDAREIERAIAAFNCWRKSGNTCPSAAILLHCRSPLLAQSGHPSRAQQCPLLGEERTWELTARMSANDPKRSSLGSLKEKLSCWSVGPIPLARSLHAC